MVIEIIGFVLGILYLIWEYRASRLLWIPALLMPLLSFWVYYRAGLYADFMMNIYYFVIAVYGFILWTRGSTRKKGPTLPIRHIPTKSLMGCLIAFALAYSAIAAWLVLGTDSTVPWLDALTTALSIVAMWMLAKKYVEQWLAWIIVDAVTVGLLIYKDRPWYALLYCIYTVVAIFGYRRWLRMMKRAQ